LCNLRNEFAQGNGRTLCDVACRPAKDFATKVCLKSEEELCSTIPDDPGEHNLIVDKRFCNKGIFEVRRRALLNNFIVGRFFCNKGIFEVRRALLNKFRRSG
jgi:hypothetical protein